jgi:hypothetical protein
MIPQDFIPYGLRPIMSSQRRGSQFFVPSPGNPC